MIKIDFTVAVAAFLTFSLLLVFLQWLFYNYKRSENPFFEVKHLLQCPYCAHVFYALEESSVMECPRCSSLIAEEGNDLKGERSKDHESYET